MRQMAERFQRSGKEQLVLLFLTDFDPEGEDIPQAFARCMRDDFGIQHIQPIKVTLTREQVRRLGLPPKMKAKQASSRHKKFLAGNAGDDSAFELEAVPPPELQRLLRQHIDGVLDRERFNAEVDAEKSDVAFLDRVRRTVHQVLREMPDWDKADFTGPTS